MFYHHLGFHTNQQMKHSNGGTWTMGSTPEAWAYGLLQIQHEKLFQATARGPLKFPIQPLGFGARTFGLAVGL